MRVVGICRPSETGSDRIRTVQQGSVLVALLWCLALLSVLVIGVLHTTTLDLRVVKNYGDQIQAHYLALAGVEKAKALIYQDAMSRRRSGRNHTGDLYDDARDFKDVQFGRGVFRIIRAGAQEEGGGVIYGISDEESKLNLNAASSNELAQVYQITPDVISGIIDWRDSDHVVSPGGAEAEYYMGLQPPYLPRDGPFQSTRELLMVRGVNQELFAGEDANLNGLLDPEEDDGNDSYPPDNHDGILDAGWSALFTVNSSVQNTTAAGENRVNVQSADENTLSRVPGLSSELAKAIVAYRGQNKLGSIADLLEVRAMRQDAVPATPEGRNPSPPSAPNRPAPTSGQPASPAPNAPQAQPVGPTLISEDLLMEIGDDVTVADEPQQAGAVNINTASVAVLSCLPGISPQLAQAIVSYRKSAGSFPNVAWLLKVQGLNRDLFKQLAPRVSARSETFRILSEGQVTSTGARQRIEVVVRLGSYDVETLSYREDL